MYQFPSIEQFRNVVTLLKRQSEFMGYDGNGNTIYLKAGAARRWYISKVNQL